MRALALLLLAMLLLACSSEEDAPAAPSGPFEPGPYQPPPTSTVVEAGAVKIRREVFTLDGFEAPANPVGDVATPVELQRIRVVRYRVDADPPQPARAIVVMMPGFVGGAGSFDPVARALVRRSTEEAPLEAWAIDRRSNLLEDHHGLDVAEHFRDPELAARYYFGGEELEGKRFEGFLAQGNLRYMAEWGLETTLEDLRRVIELVPQGERRGRVVLLGHSLGASLAEIYAAWDFAGTPGYQELASLVLVDGVAGNEGGAIPQTQEQYEKGGTPAPGGFGNAPGLQGIRGGSVYFSLPFLGTKVYSVASIVAMRSAMRPGEVVQDEERDGLLKTLLSIKEVPRMTNRAALGLSFDARSNALSFAAVNCGEATGGPLEEHDSLFGVKLLHPTDPEAIYDWVEHNTTSPREHTAQT
ncbi:MAG: alpha/beta fold hydrolase [Myxococcales bacterium]|nr:lipase family protein [Polyangiaceae bacterium]MDW8250407.1 alpha/beta fold hydrolase [Myxococcales bacterium]